MQDRPVEESMVLPTNRSIEEFGAVTKRRVSPLLMSKR